MQSPDYPISTSLRSSIESLFEDHSVAEGLLGIELDGLSRFDAEPAMNPTLSPAERAASLRRRLEGYVSLMAAELKELGEDEAPRLRAEATATLVGLRELWRHFPEGFGI
ncbi:MAG: hypothetical protein ABI599_15565 [Flavobacteriales bacterium]